MDDTPRMLEGPFGAARTLVEDTLRSVGVAPEKVIARDDASAVAWSLKRGSAKVLVSIARHEKNGDAWFRVAASVMVLPDDPAKRTSLFQRLLELNAKGLVNAAFGLVGDRVIAASERPIVGLDAVEVDQMIKHLSAVADTYDDRLVDEFGGKRAADA